MLDDAADKVNESDVLKGKGMNYAKKAKRIQRVLKFINICKEIYEAGKIFQTYFEKINKNIRISLGQSAIGSIVQKQKDNIENSIEEFTKTVKTELLNMLLNKVLYGVMKPHIQSLAQKCLRKLETFIQTATKLAIVSCFKSNSNNSKLIGKISKCNQNKLDANTRIMKSKGKTLKEMKDIYGDSLSLHAKLNGGIPIERPSYEKCLNIFT